MSDFNPRDAAEKLCGMMPSGPQIIIINAAPKYGIPEASGTQAGNSESPGMSAPISAGALETGDLVEKIIKLVLGGGEEEEDDASEDKTEADDKE